MIYHHSQNTRRIHHPSRIHLFEDLLDNADRMLELGRPDCRVNSQGEALH